MQFIILRETPVNSGTFSATGEIISTTSDGAYQHCLDLTAQNSARYAAQPYDPISRPGASARIIAGPVVYTAADASAIVTAGVAVQVFLPNSISNGAEIRNTLAGNLYLDPTGAVAVAGSPTAIPLLPGESYFFPYPPQNGVSAVSAAVGSFVSVRF